jgi:multisubunit Na+/H+ antiporter MnhE subunit
MAARGGGFMLHAAAMLFGLAILWMLASQNWSSPQDWAIALGASAACILVALRFGGASAAFWSAPKLLILTGARVAAVASGALTTIRSALSADVTLKPALVHVRTRAARAHERAVFAGMISATPGMAVVEADADGFLVHVMNEDAIDADDLGRLEQRASGGGAR